jgi:hypothetical protein
LYIAGEKEIGDLKCSFNVWQYVIFISSFPHPCRYDELDL